MPQVAVAQTTAAKASMSSNMSSNAFSTAAAAPSLPSSPSAAAESPLHHRHHEKKLRSIVAVKIAVIAVGFFLGHVIFHALVLLYDNFYASVFAPPPSPPDHEDGDDSPPPPATVEPGSKTAWMHAIYFAAFTVLICAIVAFVLYLGIARISAAPPSPAAGATPGSEYV